MGLAINKPYTVHRKILTGEILANHTGKSYWRGKFGKKASQCICQIHFWCICEYWQGNFWRIVHNLPISKFFPCTVAK